MLELKIVEIDDSSGFYQVGLPKFPVELVFCKYVESNKLFNVHDCNIYIYVHIQCPLKMKLTNFGIFRDWLKSFGTL